MKEVAVILYPGCIFFEIALAIELLARTHKITLLNDRWIWLARRKT